MRRTLTAIVIAVIAAELWFALYVIIAIILVEIKFALYMTNLIRSIL